MSASDWQEVATACAVTLVVVGVIAAKLATELARAYAELNQLKNKDRK